MCYQHFEAWQSSWLKIYLENSKRKLCRFTPPWTITLRGSCASDILHFPQLSLHLATNFAPEKNVELRMGHTMAARTDTQVDISESRPEILVVLSSQLLFTNLFVLCFADSKCCAWIHSRFHGVWGPMWDSNLVLLVKERALKSLKRHHLDAEVVSERKVYTVHIMNVYVYLRCRHTFAVLLMEEILYYQGWATRCKQWDKLSGAGCLPSAVSID